ncbi:MAG: hypothetical protein ACXWYM_00115 [Candidatus Binatia bacterium]
MEPKYSQCGKPTTSLTIKKFGSVTVDPITGGLIIQDFVMDGGGKEYIHDTYTDVLYAIMNYIEERAAELQQREINEAIKRDWREMAAKVFTVERFAEWLERQQK